MSEERDEFSDWWTIPEPFLLRIFSYLKISDVCNASKSCRRWFSIANDEFLWRLLFVRDFKLESAIGLKPGNNIHILLPKLNHTSTLGAVSWRSEYERLTTKIPLVQTELLEGHAHQVLHVSFSNNGKMFATCSKDGYVIVRLTRNKLNARSFVFVTFRCGILNFQ